MHLKEYPVIIIGASITAISFIRTMREQRETRRILLIHGEDRLPYKRTKINKHMVRGFDKEEFRITDDKWYVNNNVDLLLDRVVDVAGDKKQVCTKKGLVFCYNKLLIATGAVALVPNISGVDKDELHKVQNVEDVDRLLETCKAKERFLIIGGGVEGVETADQLIRKGKQVMMANRMRHPLLKLFPVKLLHHLEREMEKKGLKVYGGVSVSSIKKQDDGSYEINILGQKHIFDVIVACTGAVPNIELGIKAGVNVERGIVVDEFMQTSNASILAAGDVAQHTKGEVTGLWHAAEHQGRLAAFNVLGERQAHALPPFRLKTEVFGLYMFSAAYEKVLHWQDEAVEEHEGEVHRIMYYTNNKLKAVVFVGDGGRAKMYQKALIEGWSKDKVIAELPLLAGPTFLFTPSV